MTSPEVELRRVWHRVVGRGHDDAMEGLLARHREPHRRYHTATHVMWVCRHVDRLAAVEPVADLDAVLTAALFHDAVYDPTAGGNEEASALLAGRCADELGWAPSRRAEVERLVRATADHAAADTDTDAAVLIDADLSVLAAHPTAYTAYAVAVRAEYAHVDAAQWASGRAAVLRALLDRDHLFHTAHMRATAESRARANISAELATLSHP